MQRKRRRMFPTIFVLVLMESRIEVGAQKTYYWEQWVIWWFRLRCGYVGGFCSSLNIVTSWWRKRWWLSWESNTSWEPLVWMDLKTDSLMHCTLPLCLNLSFMLTWVSHSSSPQLLSASHSLDLWPALGEPFLKSLLARPFSRGGKWGQLRWWVFLHSLGGPKKLWWQHVTRGALIL